MDAQSFDAPAVVTPPRALVMAAAGAVATVLLMLPAVLNGYPFLFYDSGGYLESAFSHVVMPGRSSLYGLLLRAGSLPDFWPVAIVQSGLCVWAMGVVLRVQGLGGRPGLLVGLCAVLAATTALPFVSAELMPDIFAGLAALALYLLLWRRADIRNGEAWGCAALLAIGGASHSSVLAISLLCIAAAVAAAAVAPRLRPRLKLRLAVVGVVIAMVLNPLVNFTMAGRFAQTPGGISFIFGRMLEDGIVFRYLADHCPSSSLKLCDLREELPATADDFLWDDDAAFNALGGFEGGAEEMRRVVVGSLIAYPLDNARLAVRAMLRQLVLVQTGDLMSEELTDSYDVIRDRVPAAYARMLTAIQQQNPPIDFDRINLVHVPVALAASLGLVLAVGVLIWRRQRELALLAGSMVVVLVANAAVCGILSNPHDRYQARIAWIAVVVLFIVAVSAAEAFRRRWPGRRSRPIGLRPPAP